ncbi:MAG TPA: ABC transporter permease [Caulobacteraceae bacterium]|nr:ABC transporter permease [Caulobacteraceae bacterium]
MNAPIWLIAEREFRAYAATFSFWVALAVGPLVMAGVLGLASLSSSGGPPPPTPVAIDAADPGLTRSAAAAITEAANVDGKRVVIVQGVGAPARLTLTRLTLTRDTDGDLDATLSGSLPLSPAARALLARTLERDEARHALALAAEPRLAGVVRMASERAPPKRGPDAAGLSRFTMVMLLWLTLTGSLGMLLQAVVRERANRALESLLAAASPVEIVYGKLLGVGAVSGLVLLAWLGSAAAMAPLAPQAGGIAGALIQGLAAPLTLARAGAIYILSYAFYGLVTVAVGAAARDSAAAQNLSRPMFAVLLAAFFAALVGATGGAAKLGWLVYLPPFTPFMLLLQPAGDGSVVRDLTSLGLLAGATLMAGAWAVRGLALSPPAFRFALFRR